MQFYLHHFGVFIALPSMNGKKMLYCIFLKMVHVKWLQSIVIDGKPTVLGYLMIGLQERVHIYRRRGASPKGVTSLEEAQGTRRLVVQIKR